MQCLFSFSLLSFRHQHYLIMHDVNNSRICEDHTVLKDTFYEHHDRPTAEYLHSFQELRPLTVTRMESFVYFFQIALIYQSIHTHTEFSNAATCTYPTWKGYSYFQNVPFSLIMYTSFSFT